MNTPSSLSTTEQTSEREIAPMPSVEPGTTREPIQRSGGQVLPSNNNSGLCTVFDTLPSYDTVRIFLRDVSIYRIHQLRRALGNDDHSGHYIIISKQVANMKIRERSDGLLIEGSLPIFLRGNNLEPMHLIEVPAALAEISEALGVDVSGGTVRRLDIGANLMLDQCVDAYFTALASAPRCNREVRSGSSLKFSNLSKVLSFYDKLREIKRRHQRLPMKMETLTGQLGSKHLLRYEYQCRTIENLFPRGIRASLLSTEPIYSAILTHWMADYHGIVKDLTSYGGSDESCNLPTLRRELEALGIQSIGLPRLQEHLETLVRQGLISRTQKARYIRAVKILLGRKRGDEKQALAEELDRKLELAYRRGLEQFSA